MSQYSLIRYSSILLVSLLTACGGGGGGGGDNRESGPTPTPPPVYTTLPVFLQGNEANCTVVENNTDVSLENYQGDLNNVTAVNCDGATLSSLQEIELLPQLQTLSVPTSGLADISALQAVATTSLISATAAPSGLADLDISGNPITDFSALNGLTSLRSLNLNGTAFSDLSLLQNLSGLTSLSLGSTQLTSTSGLEALMSLTTLDLSNNDLLDISYLAALTQLETVLLQGNDNLTCSDVVELEGALETPESGPIVVVPAACSTAFTLTRDSDANTDITNSLEAVPFDRVVVLGEYSLNDVQLLRSGDNSAFRLNTDLGSHQVTFIDWYLDDNNTVGIFEMPDGMEYTYSGLVGAITLTYELTDGDDVFEGTIGKDTILGLMGNDIILGEKGADILVGGKGDDVLIGYTATIGSDGSISSYGNTDRAADTYIYNAGDGNDIIYTNAELSNSQRDVLVFGDGVLEADITLYQDGNNLILYFDESNSITISNWFYSDAYRIQTLQFGDSGPVDAFIWVWNQGVTLKEPGTLQGTSSSELLLGTNGNDIILGGKGADTIEGGKGDDILISNSATIGDDGSVSSAGFADSSVDTYIYNAGDGNDTIYTSYEYSLAERDVLVFGDGVLEADITLYHDFNNLILYFDESNSITIVDWFHSEESRIQTLQFGDSDPVDAMSWVWNMPITIIDPGTFEGTDGNDIILGGTGANTIEGGKGDDILIGYTATIGDDGSVSSATSTDSFVDTYIYNAGDGNDTIYTGYEVTTSERDVLVFGPNITVDNLTAAQSGNDLIITISTGGSITINSWFSSLNYRLNTIQFDGEAAQSAQTLVDSLLSAI